jgi:NAD(P)-dependent dehydrogenase (short-subunit alcohol dehydrogenase family)
MSSVAGKLASAGNAAYSASKFALEALSDALAAEMRPFNVRVNVVEPGVIDTPIFGKAPDLSGQIYPGARRLNAIFHASLERPVPASVIGAQVRDLLDDQGWQIRYPGGPAAAAVMAWRASVTDDQFTAIAALDDKAWCEFYETKMGLPVTHHLLR